MKRRLDTRLYYFTVEDESLLGEVFPRFEDDTYAIAYKVADTDDVFVTTAETDEQGFELLKAFGMPFVKE